jgi:hypothetical protein
MIMELANNEIESVTGGVTIKFLTIAQPVSGGKSFKGVVNGGDPTYNYAFRIALEAWQAQYPLLDRMNFGFQTWP